MATTTSNEIICYNPASIVGIFNNALTIEITKKAFRVRGVYIADENSDACVTLLVPASIRHNLTADQTIEFSAYLSKRVQPNAGKIEVHINVIEIFSQQESQYSEEQLERFELLRRKAEQGYKDVDSFIKSRIVQQRPAKVCILVGKNAIIDSDIKHQLKEAIGLYEFQFIKINLSSADEIIRAFAAYSNSDILVIARGGGENMQIFNTASIAEKALSLPCIFLTAIGHKEDTSLLQKMADKAFITPTALGQYFNEIYNHTIEELQFSKAKLVEDITTQLKGNYEMQLTNLNEKLKGNKDISDQQLQLAHTQIEDLKSQLTKRSSVPLAVWLLLLLIAVAAGIFIGWFYFIK